MAPNQYYTQAVAWAKENGLVHGVTDTLFRPADSITREQFAAIVYRYASWKEQDVTAQADLTSFADAGGVSAYAQIPMAWAVADGLDSGPL
ncbi:MAG: S-layer homology domain-containing protein [Oscillospiraceae bacterium]